MKHLNILVLLFAQCRGFIIPAGLPAGHYSVAIDSHGNALSEPTLIRSLDSLISSSSSSSPSAINRRAPPKLPSPTVNCHNRSLNIDDFLAAYKAFNNMCDSGEFYPANSAQWVTAGSAVAYMCNYDESSRCWREEYAQANSLLDVGCGQKVIGWVSIDAYKKSYGRENSGVNIC
jgi:hypothetical protein